MCKIGQALASLGDGASSFSNIMTQRQDKDEAKAYRQELLQMRRESLQATQAEKAQRLQDKAADVQWQTFRLLAGKLRNPLQILALGQQMGVMDENGSRIAGGVGTAMEDAAIEDPNSTDPSLFNATKDFEGFSYDPPKGGGKSSVSSLLASFGGGKGKKKGGGKPQVGSNPKGVVTLNLGGQNLDLDTDQLNEAQQTATMAAQDEKDRRAQTLAGFKETVAPPGYLKDVDPKKFDRTALTDIIGSSGGAGAAYANQVGPEAMANMRKPVSLINLLGKQIQPLPDAQKQGFGVNLDPTGGDTPVPEGWEMDEFGVLHKVAK